MRIYAGTNAVDGLLCWQHYQLQAKPAGNLLKAAVVFVFCLIILLLCISKPALQQLLLVAAKAAAEQL
jgi:hypothetical protein